MDSQLCLKNVANLQEIYESLQSKESGVLNITREQNGAIQEAFIAYIYKMRDMGVTCQELVTKFYPTIRSRNIILKIQRREWWPMNNYVIFKILEKLVEVYQKC